MTAPLNLDALQALCDAATPGEWQFSPDDGAEIWIEGRGIVAEVSGDADRAFIAAARTALPALIQEVRLLEAKLFNADHDLERLRDDNAELRRKNLALYQSLAGFTGNA